MKFKKIDSISDPSLRKLSESIDQSAVGNADGLITTAEIEEAANAGQGNSFTTSALQDYVEQFGDGAGTLESATTSVNPTAPTFSPLSIHFAEPGAEVDDTLTLSDVQHLNGSEKLFRVPYSKQDIRDGQSVEIPLEGRQIHMIELKYQDTRKLRDLEFNVRDNEAGWSAGWTTIRGDQYHDMVAKEKAGEVTIKRESDHNAPWINNPVRVKVEIVYPDGNVHQVGKKFLDFHVHDAHSPDSSGYPETDNINRTYENIPHGKLPEGSVLRLTPVFTDKKEWEAERDIAAKLSWVKPIYTPEHTEKVSILSGYSFQDINADGYEVDPNRPIAGVLVKWTDNGGTASGSVSFDTAEGSYRSSSYNVGSGETELIPLDNHIAKDGKIKINGYGIQIASIEVMYAD